MLILDNIKSTLTSSSIFDSQTIEQELISDQRRKRIIAATLRAIYAHEPPNAKLADEVEGIYEQIYASKDHSCLELEERQNSKVDDSSKLLFKTHDGHLIESVILRSLRPDKNSVCISTQVGCTEKCHFCATGTMDFKRNLERDEILEQVLHMRRVLKDEGRKLTHVVFMGMGEPLRNYEAVSASLFELTSMKAFRISPQDITVSTLGIPNAMLQLAHDHPQVHLALSLHAPDNALRSKIMPINDRHDISELLYTLEQIEAIHHYPIMISYILFDGLNDHINQAKTLIEKLRGRRIIFNLIPFNTIPGELVFKKSSQEKFQPFKNILIQAGFPVTVRKSFGPDIDAACGQLVTRSN